MINNKLLLRKKLLWKAFRTLLAINLSGQPPFLISNERSRKYKHTLLTVKELLTVLEISLGTEPLNSYWGHKPRGLRQHVVKTNYSKLLLFYTTFQNIPPF